MHQQPGGRTAFGSGLKAWREQRRMSQLELALAANVSARHISFLESGRARPSRQMVLQLAETMALPLRQRNELLEQAGYARAFAEAGLDAASLAPVRQALGHMLAGHMPFPALICDRHWNLVDANPAAGTLLGPLLADGERNIIRVIAGTAAARAAIANWEEVVAELACRLRLEVARSGGDPALAALLALLEKAAPARPAGDATGRPFVAVEMRRGEATLSLMSMLAEFGTPRDISIADLRIELFFPADQASEAMLRADAAG